MIFKYDEMGASSIFKGRVLENPKDWESYLPSPSLTEKAIWDKAFAANLGIDGWHENVLDSSEFQAISFLTELGFYNMVSATRQAIGEIAQISGFVKNDFHNIKNVYEDKIDVAVNSFITAESIVSSDLFKSGLDALGAIPIVGWIIKIVAKIATTVAKVVRHFKNKKEEEALQEILDQYYIPVQSFDIDSDQALTQVCLEHIADNESQWIARPIFNFVNQDQFRIYRERLSDIDPITRGFVLGSTKLSTGLGFVPGTRILNRQIKFPTGGCADVADFGNFFPTSEVVAAQWWDTVLKRGPSMFTVDTNRLYKEWENYIYNLIIYSDSSIKKGWTCERTGVIDTNKFTCIEDLYNYKGCKSSKVGENLPSSSDGHYYAFRKYLFDLFFNYQQIGLPLKNNQNGATADNIEYSKSVPAKSLDNLLERQVDVLDSIYCMYVNDSTRFAAIKNSPELKKQWKENVQAIIQSGDWKKVVFDDVPDGQVKNALYQLCKNNNIKCEDLGKGLTITQLATKTVLGDPEPPAPPEPVELDRRSEYEKRKTSKIIKRSNSPIILIAAAAAGILFIKNRK